MTVGSAIWGDQLTGEERAVIAGQGAISDPRPDVLVVGGGILGVAAAAACHETGLGSVQLIEAGSSTQETRMATRARPAVPPDC